MLAAQAKYGGTGYIGVCYIPGQQAAQRLCIGSGAPTAHIVHQKLYPIYIIKNPWGFTCLGSIGQVEGPYGIGRGPLLQGLYQAACFVPVHLRLAIAQQIGKGILQRFYIAIFAKNHGYYYPIVGSTHLTIGAVVA
jgi:hypothetical protein